MLKIRNIVLSFILLVIGASTVYAVQGCCSYHGGVCGFKCCDGVDVPVSSPACIYAPRDYYQNLYNQCQIDANKHWGVVNSFISGSNFYAKAMINRNAYPNRFRKIERKIEKIYLQMTKVNTDTYAAKTRVENRHAPMSAIIGEQAAIERQRLTKITSLAMQAQTKINALRATCEDIQDEYKKGFNKTINTTKSCNLGFLLKNNKCIAKSSICGKNQYFNSEKNNCYCKNGYLYDKKLKKCITYQVFCAKTGMFWDAKEQNCSNKMPKNINTCVTGYIAYKRLCVKSKDICPKQHSHYDANSETCPCDKGYSWNNIKQKCDKNTKTKSKKTTSFIEQPKTVKSNIGKKGKANIIKAGNFKIITKLGKKNVLLVLFNPNKSIAKKIKKYQVSLKSNNKNQPIILHRKKLMLFRPKNNIEYKIGVTGIDTNNKIIAKASFSFKK